MKTCIRFVLFVAVTVGVAAPAFAWWPPVNDSEEPGSVIVFHKFIRGNTADFRPITQFEISATCPKGSTCTQFQTVRLRAHWVCPGDASSVCQEADFNLFTTVNGTLVFGANGSGALAPPCDRGYLIAWVIDDSGNPIKFDSLIGDAVISEGPTSARGYNALPIQAGEFLSTGDLTDVNGNGALDFDDSEYQAITGKIFGTVRYETTTTRTDLTLLTLDVHSNLPNDTTFVGLNFYDQFETLRSTATNFVCWSEQRLTDIDSALNAGFGFKGLVESTGAVQSGTPVTLVGIVETSEQVTLPVTAPPQTIPLTIVVPACVTGLMLPAGCTATESFGCPILGSTTISCTVTAPAQFLTVAATRDVAYSLFNDSTAVLTTFWPF
jgi:hypothetical protein